MKNELLIASAGAGKTTHFVKESLKYSDSVLITTFTEENEKEIKKKFIELNKGIIPINVTIITWFSFLIEHGAKPYQGTFTDKRINGLLLVNEKSGIKYKGKRYPVYYGEDNEQHYFTKDFQIYSDKLSKFVVRCNKESDGRVIDRISALFDYIFIDEVQDMAGYDLEIIKLLFRTNSIVKIAGDPRQVTYHTHFADKYKKYSNGKIQEFVENECKSKSKCSINTDTLKGSWRNNKIICDFANKIFLEYIPCESLQTEKTAHDGVFLVKEKDVEKYLQDYSPTQLRYSRAIKVNNNYEVKNFGESKGITRDRVLIYPTQKISDWLFENKELKSFETRCKFYVAVTRAKYSVGIVCKNSINTDILPIYV